MSFIIVWRNNHRDPHLDVDSHQFLETYPSFDAAKAAAEEIERTENSEHRSEWYFNHQIYEQVE